MYFRSKEHWGTHIWNYIHTISIIDFDSEETNLYHSKKIYDILKTLKFSCQKCQIEFDNELNNIDINLLCKSMYLFKWSYDLHNKINEKLNKPLLTYEDALKKYTIEI